MTDLLTPEEIQSWEPLGPENEGLDPYYNRLYRAYLTLWDCNKELAKYAAHHEDVLRKIAMREGRFSMDHKEHAINTIEAMAGRAEARLRGEEYDD